MSDWFRCKTIEGNAFVNDAICANRKVNFLDHYPECKKCEGRNLKIVKKKRKYTKRKK
jgi:hypothetical protein